MPLNRRTLMTLCGTSLVSGAACGGRPDEPEAPDISNLPPYQGQLAQLFDDGINPLAVGVALDAATAAEDPMLRPRMENAELVARVRIQTVTVDVVGAVSRYTLGVQVGQPPLIAPEIDDIGFEFDVGPEQAAYSVLESMGDRLRGRTFVGLIRRFAGRRGLEHHFHFTADVQEVHDAVRQWSGLSALDLVPA